MCVRVSSGGRVLILLSITLFPTPTIGADPVALDALGHYRAAQATSHTGRRMSGVVEYRQSDGAGPHSSQPGRYSQVHVSAKINRAINANWSLQKNLKHNRSQLNDGKMQHTQGSTHLYYRDPESYAVGAFAALDDTRRQEDKNAFPFTGQEARRQVAAGVEAALFSEKATLLALAGVRSADLENLNANSAFAGLGARYYLTEQLRFEMRGTFERPLDKADKAHAYNLDTAFDYRPDELAFSTFGGYRYRLTETGGDQGAADSNSSHGVFAGFRYHFGNDSLQEEERFGALWPDLPLGL